MKKVVDANFLRNIALEDYFKADKKNLVVLTDYACMECYKGNALKNFKSSLEIASRYPEQVVILKGTREVIALQVDANLEPANFVDSEQTNEFRDFSRDVALVEKGNPRLTLRLTELSKIAHAHFNCLRDDAAGVSEAIQLTAKTFSPSQLSELRRRGTLSSETLDVIVRNVLLLAACLFKVHPDVPHLQTADHVRDSFVFRFALATQLLVVRWLTDGGIESVATRRLSNDIVDVGYVAYATMFDGILSEDGKLVDIYEEAVYFLRTVFARDTYQSSLC